MRWGSVPPLWHWTYFLPAPRQSQLGTDGHPVKDGFLPPITLPRRMWAGSQIEFLRPLHVGEAISRRSTISDVSFKEGRTGLLAFVKLGHETSNEGGIAIVGNQDIVFLNPTKPGEGPATPTIARTDAQWSRKVQPTAPLLFSVLGSDLQRSPNPLRPTLCGTRGGLQWRRRARALDRDAVAQLVAQRTSRRTRRCVRLPRCSLTARHDHLRGVRANVRGRHGQPLGHGLRRLSGKQRHGSTRLSDLLVWDLQEYHCDQ